MVRLTVSVQGAERQCTLLSKCLVLERSGTSSVSNVLNAISPLAVLLCETKMVSQRILSDKLKLLSGVCKLNL